MASFVSVIISGNSKPLSNALAKATVGMSDFQKKIALGFAAAGAASAAFAASAIRAAAKDQVAMAELERVIKSTTGATTEQVHAQENFLKTVGRSAAFSKSALIPGYEALIVATRNAGEAQKILNIGLDVARARHLDVSTVLEALAKGYAGNTRALRALSPELKKLIADGASFDEVLIRLNENFGGAGAEYAKTFQGRLDILGNSVNALKKKIGEALLPVVEKLVPIIQAFVDTLAQHPGVVKAAAIAIGALAGAFAIATTAVVVHTVAVKAAAIANAVLASSFLAVELSTGVAAAIALAAAAAITLVTKKVVGGIKANLDYANSISDVTDAMGNEERFAQYVHQQELDRIAAEEAARKKAEELAKKREEERKKRYQTFVDDIKSAKQAIREYVAAIRDQINSEVSLSTAFAEASDQSRAKDDQLKTALEDRKDAYAALNQAKINNDVQAYNDALGKVAEAEKAVKDAQEVKPKNYSEIFATQIQAAKDFAGYIKQLAAAGLGKAGLAQILDLGPVAGAQVAKDLLSGTGGLTIGGLKADLAAIAQTGTEAGMAIPGFGAALSATPAGQKGNVYQITIQAGVGDKVEIGKQVVEVLQAYEKRLGGIPIKVK